MVGERQVTAAGGLLHYRWVVAGAAFVAVFAAAAVPFLVRLPAGTRWRFVAAGVLFVAGALGFESLAARQAWAFDHGTTYTLLTAVEEGLEMTGAAVFLVALLRHAERHHGPVRLEIVSRPGAPPPTAGA